MAAAGAPMPPSPRRRWRQSEFPPAELSSRGLFCLAREDSRTGTSGGLVVFTLTLDSRWMHIGRWIPGLKARRALTEARHWISVRGKEAQKEKVTVERIRRSFGPRRSWNERTRNMTCQAHASRSTPIDLTVQNTFGSKHKAQCVRKLSIPQISSD